MYQLERSSRNDSNDRITSTVSQRSYASVASATSCRVRSTSQRSSGASSPSGPSRSSERGVKDSTLPYCTRNVTEFQRVSSFRWISCAGPKPNSRFRSGGWAQYCQRITSAPMRANASCASIMFPHEPCISRPVSSSIFS